MGVYQVCSNKSLKIGIGPAACIQVSDFRAIMALLFDVIIYRNAIARLRLNLHNLNIEIGRHNNIERNRRYCVICNSDDIEDKFHFVLINKTGENILPNSTIHAQVCLILLSN
jgi:hypothetical protein